MIQEATALSTALTPKTDFRYELLTLAPVPSLYEGGTQSAPSLRIRVLKAGMEVALWGLGTFQNRLNLIRQACQACGLRTDHPGAVGGAVTASPAIPWRKLSQPRQGELTYQFQQAPDLAKHVVQVDQHPKGDVYLKSTSVFISPRSVNPQAGAYRQASTQPCVQVGLVSQVCDRLQSVQSPISSPRVQLRTTEPITPQSPFRATRRQSFEI